MFSRFILDNMTDKNEDEINVQFNFIKKDSVWMLVVKIDETATFDNELGIGLMLVSIIKHAEDLGIPRRKLADVVREFDCEGSDIFKNDTNDNPIFVRELPKAEGNN